MLYYIYEAQRSLLEPFADFAQATAKLYSNPLLPLSKSFATQRTVAAFDLFYRLAKDYEKPQFGIQSVQVNGVDVTIRERVEIDKPFCEHEYQILERPLQRCPPRCIGRQLEQHGCCQLLFGPLRKASACCPL